MQHHDDELQAAQVRKSSFVTCDDDGEGAHGYQPEKAHTNTIFAGTVIEQVWPSSAVLEYHT